MGWMDWFRRKASAPVEQPTLAQRMVSAAALDSTADFSHTYDNRNITFSGDLKEYDYDTILRDKQGNINSLYELSDYYIDKDPIYRGIVKGVYATFAVTDWKLIGTDEKTKEKYQQYYERINLKDRMASILYQYFKYGNVYIYLMEDGSITTLPVHKTRIANVMLNGEPIVEFNAQSLQTDIFNQGAVAEKPFVDDEDIETRLLGFPKEVADAVNTGAQWVQLNPENTFVLQDLKEDWMRYAVPMIAPCLTGLAKKALIEHYEDALLNLGINSFVHVRYGNEKDTEFNLMPSGEELRAVQRIFSAAMKGSALAVTNQYAKAEVVQPDTDDLFEHDKYKNVNSEILSAGGISGIIVSGRADDGSTFASAQVSMNTADKRIEVARRNFCELMNKINRRVNGSILTRSSGEKVPKFTLLPIDLSGNSKFQKTCKELWEQGCMSTQTLLQAYGFDYEQELSRKKSEISNGSFQTLSKEALTMNDTDGNTSGTSSPGRPRLEMEDRTSDESKAETGRAPKPSSPEGSERKDE